jgi:hypothetical protein
MGMYIFPTIEIAIVGKALVKTIPWSMLYQADPACKMAMLALTGLWVRHPKVTPAIIHRPADLILGTELLIFSSCAKLSSPKGKLD